VDWLHQNLTTEDSFSKQSSDIGSGRLIFLKWPPDSSNSVDARISCGQVQRNCFLYLMAFSQCKYITIAPKSVLDVFLVSNGLTVQSPAAPILF
jgi:hypothetical protein